MIEAERASWPRLFSWWQPAHMLSAEGLVLVWTVPARSADSRPIRQALSYRITFSSVLVRHEIAPPHGDI